jgi:DNA-binding protein HU-beta
MNKGDLIDAIARDAAITKTQAQNALDSLVDNVQSALRQGQKVTVVGFGTFSSSKREARVGRNPQTGASIQIAAKKVVKFAAGKALKDGVQ